MKIKWLCPICDVPMGEDAYTLQYRINTTEEIEVHIKKHDGENDE